MSAVDAIIFDLGNVLVFHDNALLFRRLGELAGIDGPTVGQKLLEDPLWVAANRGTLDCEAIRAAVCGALDLTLGPAEFADLWSCHFTPNLEVFRVVEALIGKVKLALLSNANPLHVAYLRPRTAVLQRFDVVAFSCELGWVKPEPEIYRTVLRRLGTAPARTAFFDDAPEFVAAARAIGIDGHVFEGAGPLRERLAAWGLL